MIMSATFPSSLVEMFQSLLEKSAPVEIIRDQELLQAHVVVIKPLMTIC